MSADAGGSFEVTDNLLFLRASLAPFRVRKFAIGSFFSDLLMSLKIWSTHGLDSTAMGLSRRIAVKG